MGIKEEKCSMSTEGCFHLQQLREKQNEKKIIKPSTAENNTVCVDVEVILKFFNFVKIVEKYKDAIIKRSSPI